MKDYIDIIDNMGNKVKIEVVSIIKPTDYKFNYIIYKDLNSNHYYAGKYTDENTVDLDTNLTNEELDLINMSIKS